MTRRTVLAASLAAAAAPAVLTRVAMASAPVERVQRHVLANGLEIVAIPDHRVPVITHMLWYRVGSADEERGKSGLAHFLEHLLFKGTERHPGNLFQRAVTAVGGTENAFTSLDYTGYFQRIARDEIARMMDFEADRMTNIVLTDEVVDPERDVVLEERRQRTDNVPGARLGERLSAELWGPDHPYGVPVIGWENEIRGLTREDALVFYRRHYAPNNAILIVAGDITPEEVIRLAEPTYGAIARNPAIQPRSRPPGPERTARGRVRLADPKVAQPSMSHSLIVPSYSRAAAGEAEALDVLAQILGTSPTGRMVSTLVTERGLAASAGAFYAGSALGQGRFALHAAPRPGVPLDRLEAAIDDVLARLLADGVGEDEVERAKTRLIADSVFSQDSQASMGRMYGAALTTGSAVDDLQAWPGRVRAVTRAAVEAVARRHLDLNRAVTAELVRGEEPAR
ncbi:M16 family metallopeptidase [Phreatobacter sp.]|uniref:M16 family metallopeptidase n=1 Tax=Phreatobacter sp. TaxID=1966341 RepID=UPI003F722FBF